MEQRQLREKSDCVRALGGQSLWVLRNRLCGLDILNPETELRAARDAREAGAMMGGARVLSQV